MEVADPIAYIDFSLKLQPLMPAPRKKLNSGYLHTEHSQGIIVLDI